MFKGFVCLCRCQWELWQIGRFQLSSCLLPQISIDENPVRYERAQKMDRGFLENYFSMWRCYLLCVVCRVLSTVIVNMEARASKYQGGFKGVGVAINFAKLFLIVWEIKIAESQCILWPHWTRHAAVLVVLFYFYCAVHFRHFTLFKFAKSSWNIFLTSLKLKIPNFQ